MVNWEMEKCMKVELLRTDYLTLRLYPFKKALNIKNNKMRPPFTQENNNCGQLFKQIIF